MPACWNWRVSKTSFSGLEGELRKLADAGFEICQIIAVQEVKPARVPFEVVIVSRTEIIKDAVQSFPACRMNYSPPPKEVS